MEILTLHLRDDRSTLIRTKIKKEKIKIVGVQTFDSVIADMKAGDVDSIGEKILDALETSNISVQPVIITVPSSCLRIDCWPSDYVDSGADEELKERLEQFITSDNEQKWLTDVIQATDRRGGIFISGAAIRKAWIDALIEACQILGIEVVRIEPEILSVFRCVAADGIVLDTHSEKAVLTAYIKGKGFMSSTGSIDRIEDELTIFEVAVDELFGNVQISEKPIYLYGSFPFKEFCSIDFQQRFTKIHLPIDISIDKNFEVDEQTLLSTAGIVVSYIDELNPIGESVNFIPDEIRKLQKKNKIKANIQKILQRTAVGLTIIFLFELGIIGFNQYNREKISPALKAQYEVALTEKKRVDKWSEILQKAANEDRELVKVADTLAFIRPDGIKLTKIDISDQGNIQIEGHASDPALFNLYVSKINSENRLFQNAQLEKIASTQNGSVKSFVVQAKYIR